MTATATSPDRRHDAAPGAIEASVALCTWNGGRWLRSMLESLNAQTVLPDELVVLDDGSTDDSLAVLEEFATRARFAVRISQNPERLGSTRNFAAALARCRGDVLLLADQDDVWYPSKIERLLAELETDPTLTMVFSDADLIGEDGRRVGRGLWDTRKVGGVLRRHPVVPEELFARRALTTGCTMAVRRRTLDAALPFPAVLDDEVAPMRHDRWLSLVAASTGTVRALPESLLGFRVHPAQQTGVLIEGQLRNALGRAVAAVLRGDPGAEVPVHRVRAVQLQAAAERADTVGDFEQAATLRRVARHHELRADRAAGVADRVRDVVGEIRRGGYGRGPLAAAAAAADLVRAVRSSAPERGRLMALRRTRVLMVVDTLAMGGAERVAVDVANSLDRDRYEVSFCASRADGPLRETLAPDVPVRVLGRAATWDVRKLAAFASFVREGRFDLIHSHGRGTMRLVALCRASGLIRSTHVFHDHFASLHTQRGADVFLRNALRLGVDMYIGVDSRLCTWARTTAGVPADRVHLVRSGVDVSRFAGVTPIDLHQELGLRPDDLAMVMVANFRPQKDHPTLFRAMAELPAAQRARLQLVVVGSTDADRDYFTSCMVMAQHLGLTDQIHLLGARDDAPELLAGADAAVISSKNETGPLVILEYMASGLPFVATETGEIARAVKGQGCGLVPPPRDHRALAAAMATLLAMTPEERAAMGGEGRRVVAEQFDQRVVSRQIERLYERVLRLIPAR